MGRETTVRGGSMFGTMKRTAKRFVPQALWTGARGYWRALAGGARIRTLRTLAEIEAEFARVDAAMNDGAGVSHDAAFAILDSFRLAYPTDLPTDPNAPEYREREMAF